jgi:hypothetical protein
MSHFMHSVQRMVKNQLQYSDFWKSFFSAPITGKLVLQDTYRGLHFLSGQSAKPSVISKESFK